MTSPEQKEKTLMCTSNYEDNSFDVEAIVDGQVNAHKGGQDVAVDIVECTEFSERVLNETECEDATEYSSSFGDTDSATEDGAVISEHEVESQLHGGNDFSSVSDGVSAFGKVRKRKLTDHWRRYIRPLMWRCKWVELQIEKLQCQALKYDKEVEEYDKRKQVEYNKFASEGVDSKSHHFSCFTQPKKIMKRRKRKRVEEKSDVASYTSQHNLFSYYEDKKSVFDGATLDDKYVNTEHKSTKSSYEIAFDDEWPLLEFRDGDKFVEQILWKIEVAQAEARKHKSRIDKVLSTYPVKFSCANKLSHAAPSDALASSAQNAASLENGDKIAVGFTQTSSHNISEGKTGDPVMPEGAVSSHEDDTSLTDMMIQTTEQTLVNGSSETSQEDDKSQIHNMETKGEMEKFERVMNQLAGKQPSSSMEKPSTSHLTSRSRMPNRKRKRSRKISGSGGWRRSILAGSGGQRN